MFKTSQNITNIAKALNEAQKLMKFAKKDASNPFFKSQYADLGAVIEASKDALNNNGITILQPHRTEEINGVLIDYVDTVLLHTSGEYISSSTRVEVAKKNDPQALGSGISYARRYGLQSLVSLPAADDDGEGAMNRTKTSTAAAASGETKAAATGARQKFRRPVTNGASAPVGDSHDI